MEGYDANQRTTAYRFDIPDPVPFTKSLKVAIEHKGAHLQADGTWNGYLERADDYSSVAYWYQTEPHVEFFKMPPVEDRLYVSKAVSIEAESLISTAESVGPKPVVQELPGWSGGAQLFFMPKEQNSSVTLKLPVKKAGSYDLQVYFTKSWDYGVYQVYLDGNPINKRFDLYSPDVIQAPVVNLGRYQLSAGDHLLKFQCTGQNPVSQGYYLGVDFIELASDAK
jgi:hypothetical protein